MLDRTIPGRLSKKGHFHHNLDHSRSSRRAIRSSCGNWAKRGCLLLDPRPDCSAWEGGKEQKGTEESLKLSKGSGD